MKRKILAALLATSTLSGPTTAGELRFSILSYQPLAADPEIALTSNELELQHRDDGTWAFAFKDDENPQAHLVVRIKNPPAGYSAGPWMFDVPYDKDDAPEQEFSLALSNDPSNDGNTRTFLRTARHMPVTVASEAQLALLHQRSRKIFEERYKRVTDGDRLPDRDDVSVAYWLLLSARELMEKRGLEPDDVTKQAMTWIAGIAADPDDARRLLDTGTVPRAEAESLVRSLLRQKQLMTERIVRQIADDIALPRTSERGCAHARGLNRLLDSLDDDTLTQTDPKLRSSLETTTNVVICLARRLKASRERSERMQFLPEAKSLYEELVAEADRMGKEGRAPKLREIARSRAKELLDIINATESDAAVAVTPSG